MLFIFVLFLLLKGEVNMLSDVKVITNNPMTKEKIPEYFELEYIDGDVEEVFKRVRDYVHKGHTLLTHPLMSSVKPNETPYRTILISNKKNENVDFESLQIIEDSIASLLKFMKMFNCPDWNERIKKDFMIIDYDLINNVINK